MVTTRFGSGDTIDYASAEALQSDGKTVVAGYSNASGSYALALARHLPNDITGAFIAVLTPGGPPIDSAL